MRIWFALPSFGFGYPDLLRVAARTCLLTYRAALKGVIHVRVCRFVLPP